MTKTYYADYLSCAVRYCQDKGLDYKVTLLPEPTIGYAYTLTVKDVGLYHHFWLTFHIL